MNSCFIIGSCITRDIFNSKFTDYSDKYKVKDTFYQGTLCSFMSPAIMLENASTEDEYCNKMINLEATKESRLHLDSDVDVLIVDFYADLIFGSFVYNNSFMTDNEWKIKQTQFYKDTKPVVYSLKENYDQFIRKFEDASIALNQKLNFEDLKPKIIINKISFTGFYKDENGKLVDMQLDSFDTILNVQNILIAKFIEKIDLPVTIISPNRAEQFYSDVNYPLGGVGAVHYEKKFYEKALELIDMVVN